MAQPQAREKQSHRFSLLRNHEDCYYTFVNADFTCPPSVNSQAKSALPTFMADRKFFTPAFVVFRDQEYYQANSKFECSQFQKKVLKAHKICQDFPDFQGEHISICPTVPNNKYCQICKNSYDSYEDHLRQISHLRQARFSKANIFIRQLCKKYSKSTSKTGAKRNNTKIKKTPRQTVCKEKSKKVKKNKGGLESLLNGKFMNYSTNVQSLEGVLQQ